MEMEKRMEKLNLDTNKLLFLAKPINVTNVNKDEISMTHKKW